MPERVTRAPVVAPERAADMLNGVAGWLHHHPSGRLERLRERHRERPLPAADAYAEVVAVLAALGGREQAFEWAGRGYWPTAEGLELRSCVRLTLPRE